MYKNIYMRIQENLLGSLPINQGFFPALNHSMVFDQKRGPKCSGSFQN